MAELERCPCGQIPHDLIICESVSPRYAYVSGSCCVFWEIEFETDYHILDSDSCMELARAAWNEAPRGKLDTKLF